MNIPSFNIAAVERDTGLSKDVLRMWERRYGFPQPDRDNNGERCYPADQVERLRLIKRLMDAGHRPGKLIATPVEELAGFVSRRAKARPGNESSDGSELSDLLALIKQHDSNGFQQAMQQRLARQGLQRFVQDTIAPLTFRVGEAWEDGSVEVFEEHLFHRTDQAPAAPGDCRPAKRPAQPAHFAHQRAGRTACPGPADG
jgi:hypothetical protein